MAIEKYILGGNAFSSPLKEMKLSSKDNLKIKYLYE